jgi:4-hydroxy-tetrahydrodipicolinate reductase
MNKPVIAIVGYGRMGHEIEKIAKSQGYQISDIFDTDNKLEKGSNYDFDVAIEFTEPDQAVDNIKLLSDLGKNVVVGTTGWLDKSEEVRDYVKDAGNGLVWASNFSVGVQIFFRVIESFGRIINHEDGYDLLTHEMHHKNKKDSPGGTAISIAQKLIDRVDRKDKLVIDALQRKIEPNELHASSTRGGDISGTHTVIADSVVDSIELTHRAKNREGFASGSLVAADWIHGKTGFYEFGEALDSKWGLG